MGRVQDADRLGLSGPTNPFGVGPRFGEDFVVLAIGLAADDLVFRHSGGPVTIGNLFPLALHPLEDGLLVARRQIEPRDPQVDDIDSQPVAERLAFAASFRSLLAHRPRKLLERAGPLVVWALFGVLDSQQTAELDLADGGRQD